MADLGSGPARHLSPDARSISAQMRPHGRGHIVQGRYVPCLRVRGNARPAVPSDTHGAADSRAAYSASHPDDTILSGEFSGGHDRLAQRMGTFDPSISGQTSSIIISPAKLEGLVIAAKVKDTSLPPSVRIQHKEFESSQSQHPRAMSLAQLQSLAVAEDEDGTILSPESVATQRSVEDKVSMFESILHPEMLEALKTLKQLEDEELNLIDLFKQKLLTKEIVDVELRKAFDLELLLRRNEKSRTLAEFGELERQADADTRRIAAQTRALRQENERLECRLDIRDRRQEGNFRLESQLDIYDWIVDISMLGDLTGKGWRVDFSESFAKRAASEAKGSSDEGWEGAVVAVVGLYDKGKTYVLNQITQSKLPSGKKVSTKGLSFKHVSVESTNFVLLDSAGSYSPVKVINDLSVAQKEATELFLMDLIFDVADYFICVVNDFTSLDQRYLDKLMRLLQSSSKPFREIIVVHNLKDITNPKVLDHIWKTQVTHIYAGGSLMKTMVAAPNSKGALELRQVDWFKTEFSRHVCLANHDSKLGQTINPWAISLLKYWLKSVYVPVDRRYSVVKDVVQKATRKLSGYFQEPISLELVGSESSQNTMYIRPKRVSRVELTEKTKTDEKKSSGKGDIPPQSTDKSQNKSSKTPRDRASVSPSDRALEDKKIARDQDEESEGRVRLRLPQMSLDATGLMLARPDSYMPPVDIVHNPAEYIIYMDIPGLSGADVTLSRQNVITIIKGRRSVPYDENKVSVVKQERRYGQFTSTFTIPQSYERKWVSCEVSKGVLCMKFRQDAEEATASVRDTKTDPQGLKSAEVSNPTPLCPDTRGVAVSHVVSSGAGAGDSHPEVEEPTTNPTGTRVTNAEIVNVTSL